MATYTYLNAISTKIIYQLLFSVNNRIFLYKYNRILLLLYPYFLLALWNTEKRESRDRCFHYGSAIFSSNNTKQ